MRAILRSFSPAPDGRGGELELEVLRNESPAPAEDFLQPEPGRPLRAYAPDPPSLPPGCEVTVQLTLLAGPGGGRAVVQEIERARP